MESLSRGAVQVGTYSDAGRRYGVYATLEIRPAQLIGRGHTIDHAPIPPDALEVSIMGEVWHLNRNGSRDRRYREGLAYGQVLDDMDRCTGNRARRIAYLWRRWHLNGMQAACAHQSADAARIQAAMPSYAQDRERWARLSALPCPEGYRYGSAWLYEPVPTDVLAELRRLFGKPEGWTLPASAHGRRV